MYLKSSEYLSIHTGKQIDDAVSTAMDYDEKLAEKVDKTTEINGHELTENITLTADDVGALSSDTRYGYDLEYAEGILTLNDAQYDSISAVDISPTWDIIEGNIGNNEALRAAFDAKQDIITSNNKLASDLVTDANNTNKFATAEQLGQIELNKNNVATNAENIAANTDSIASINGKIPSAATTTNQLADKDFVNSSIATQTSYFIGTFQSVAELEAYSGTLTNNDYAFVETHDTAGNTFYDRYKYNSNTQQWAFEYELNNSSFTSAQWAAMNSGATETNIGQITTNSNDIIRIDSIIGGYGDIVTRNASEFASSAEGGLASTALQPGDDISQLNNNAGYITGISSSDVTTALGYTPYNSTNPDGFISGINSSDVITALGYTPYNSTNPDGYITGIDSIDVTTALGYTPYNSTNPDDFITANDVGNGAITFVQGGVTKGIITANQSGNSTIELDSAIPTITGAISNVVSNDLTANKAVISDSFGKIAVSPVSSTELSYLSGVTSNVQTQIDEKSKVTLDNRISAQPLTSQIDLKIVELTKDQYDTITPVADELYFITDDLGIASNDVTTALGYTPENITNKVTTISNASTDIQYPSAKAVYDQIILKQDADTAVVHTKTTAVGDTTTPVYITSAGVATALPFTIQKSVPANALFTDTTYSAFSGANGTSAGTTGLVPAPTATDDGKFLKGDGTWGTPAGATYNDFTGATSGTAGSHGLVPAPSAGDEDKFLKGDGSWATVPAAGTVVTFVDWSN